jgi:hypothetical protein
MLKDLKGMKAQSCKADPIFKTHFYEKHTKNRADLRDRTVFVEDNAIFENGLVFF